jgi:glycosyltransferase involved in cell wall biosynthesis
MYHGNLAAQFARVFTSKRASVIWNIRGTMTELSRESTSTAATIWLGARLSSFANAIVNNSAVSADLHSQRLGYSAKNVVVIPNGFDTTLYRPNPAAREQLRRAVDASDDDFLIGHVGRLHPMKDHETLVRAAEACIAKEPRARFVLVGADVDNRSRIIRDMADGAGIGARLNYLGPRGDIAQIVPGLDLFTLTSAYGEGFPNVVGEAMACGVPCVVTDVGDSAHVVGKEGLVVPPGDSQRLADAWLRMVSLPAAERAHLGERARQRIIEHFSLASIVQQYEELYDRVASQHRRD